MASANNAFKFTSVLAFGADLSELERFVRFVSSLRAAKRQVGRITIDLEIEWFDLALMSRLGQIILNAQDVCDEIGIDTSRMVSQPSRMKFLWEVGFWQLVRVNYRGSKIVAEPDPWDYTKGIVLEGEYIPLLDESRSNFCTLISQRISTGIVSVNDAIQDWDRELSGLKAFQVVKTKEIFQSKEYLYLLIWELLLNALHHSKGSIASLSGQIFLSRSDIDTFLPEQALENDSENMRMFDHIRLDRFAKQHSREVENSILPGRKRWLTENQNQSFLMVGCADNGIGIPDSLRHKEIGESESDRWCIQKAFSKDIVALTKNPSTFDVHGLTQIIRLVRDFGGYLCVQAGDSIVEYAGGSKWAHGKRGNASRLEGTIVQALLPVSTGISREVRIEFDTRPFPLRNETKQPRVANRIVIADELRNTGPESITLVSKWPDFLDTILKTLALIPDQIIYIDFIALPNNRQFVSYLLRVIRKYRPLAGIVVINASPELVSIVHSLERLESSPGISKQSEALGELEDEVSTIMSRGDYGKGMPLLIPFTSIDVLKQKMKLYWVGLSGIKDELRAPIAGLIEILFQEDRAVPWTELMGLCLDSISMSEEIEAAIIPAFRLVCRCNPNLFATTSDDCRLTVTSANIFFASYGSLQSKFQEDLLPRMVHKKGRGEGDYIYELGWHTTDKRFRKTFYQMWDVLEDHLSQQVCGRLLLWHLYSVVGEKLLDTHVLVSVTPSAGLLTRWLSDYLVIEGWEAPSIYEIDNTDWLPDLQGKNVIVVCDVVDTRTSYLKLVHRVQMSRGNCIAIAAFLQNQDQVYEPEASPTLVGVWQVSLGMPTEIEIDTAIKTDRYYEIDPHTLEPIPANAYQRVFTNHQDERKEAYRTVKWLADRRILTFGHFAQELHHFDIYFSLASAMFDPEARHVLLDWVQSHLKARLKETKTRRVVIVYPYYSPIYLLVQYLRNLLASNDRVRYLVAKPQQWPGNRIVYSPFTLTADEDVLFLDDGIATGNTFSSIVERLIDTGIRSILTLILFDRSGVQSRKHLTHIDRYRSSRNKDISFEFRSFVSVNLEVHGKDSCPVCSLLTKVKNYSGRSEILQYAIKEVQDLLSPHYLSARTRDLHTILLPAEIDQVVRFYDSVLSGVPSAKNLKDSITAKDKSPRVVLLLISRILCDPKLNRQFVDRKAIKELITQTLPRCYSEHEQIQYEEARSLFILFSIHWEDRELAGEFLTLLLPEAIAAIRNRMPGYTQKIDLYFQDHILEYACTTIASIALIESKERDLREGLRKSIMEGWWGIDPAAPSKSHSCSEFRFGMQEALSEGEMKPIEMAWYLAMNFLDNYSNHRTSMKSQLKLLEKLVHANEHKKAPGVISPSVFNSLLDQFRHLASAFGLRHMIPDSVLEDGRGYYREWLSGQNPSEFLNWIKMNFENVPSRKTGSLIEMLKEITPRFDRAVIGAIERAKGIVLNDAQITVRPVGTIPDCEVFGTKEYLDDSIENLLMNPIEAFQVRPKKAELSLSISADFDPSQSHIEITVVDDYGLSIEDVESISQKNNALAIQRKTWKRWGGNLEQSVVNGETHTTLRLRVFSLPK